MRMCVYVFKHLEGVQKTVNSIYFWIVLEVIISKGVCLFPNSHLQGHFQRWEGFHLLYPLINNPLRRESILNLHRKNYTDVFL